jgi:hypothetical protein
MTNLNPLTSSNSKNASSELLRRSPEFTATVQHRDAEVLAAFQIAERARFADGTSLETEAPAQPTESRQFRAPLQTEVETQPTAPQEQPAQPQLSIVPPAPVTSPNSIEAAQQRVLESFNEAA